MNSNLFARSSVTKAAASGVALGAATKVIDKADFSVKQVGLQAGCSYASPAVSDQVAPILGMLQSTPAYDALVTGALYGLSSGYLGVDYRSFLYKLLYSAGSDYAAELALPYLPVV